MPTLPETRLDLETRFLILVRDRIQRDTGLKAAFKRALSGESTHLRRLYPVVLPILDAASVSPWQQEQAWIPVACLLAYYDQPLEGRESVGDFGRSCVRLAQARHSGGTERRFRALLDTSLRDLQTPLTALVRQMRGERTAIDYVRLLHDLRFWEHPDQFIQDRWARSFWGGHPPA